MDRGGPPEGLDPGPSEPARRSRSKIQIVDPWARHAGRPQLVIPAKAGIHLLPGRRTYAIFTVRPRTRPRIPTAPTP